MREIDELKPDQLLETLPPNIRRLILARKLQKKRAKAKLKSGDLRRKYPMGGDCGLCGVFAERVYPMKLDLCERCCQRVVDHGSQIKVLSKRYHWVENPLSWAKIRCEGNCGDHRVLYRVQFSVCPRCASRVARKMKSVKRIERARE